jgi:ppGpp synthetase/RelA/SpoT-type nucleotidyltranferase
VKTRESLSQKLKRPDREYDSLDQITDLAGIRIITYFEPDVNQIASIIEDEFEIQWSDSEDKRSLLDPDRFGYSSVHYIASFSEVRCALTEYRHFAGFRFEVQIRSILQHAWAEIEHDLGYKSELSIPRETRRRFSRVAGLLELADAEFTAIRSELEEYANRVAELIESEPHRVLVDKVSLGTFLSLDSVRPAS